MASTALASRISEVGFETFHPRSPMIGIITAQPMITARIALETLPLNEKGIAYDTALIKMPQDGILSRDEGIAVHLYTRDWGSHDSSLCHRLNAALRHIDRSIIKQFVPFLKLFLSAISKHIHNIVKTLWLGVGSDLFELYQQRVGQSIVFWGFITAMHDVKDIEKHLPHESAPRTLFFVHSSLAVDLSCYSAVSHHPEMIIPAGTMFKIMNVKKNNHVTIVELMEERNLLGLDAGAPSSKEMDESRSHHSFLISSTAPTAQPPATLADSPTATTLHHLSSPNATESTNPLTSSPSTRSALPPSSQDAQAIPVGIDEAKPVKGLEGSLIPSTPLAAALEIRSSSADTNTNHHHGNTKLQFHLQAAQRGDRSAQYNLGWCYSQGRGGVAKDEREALHWYTMSADQGCAFALYNLGVYHEYGRGGVVKDPAAAAGFYRRAAEQGDDYAQCRLGVFHELGMGGLRRDSDAARRMYALAAAQGEPYSKKRLKELGGGL